MFEFRIQGTAGPARAGTLTLPHGEVQTPAFMPVGTHAVVRGLSANDVRRTGAQIIWAHVSPASPPGEEVFNRWAACIASPTWNGRC